MSEHCGRCNTSLREVIQLLAEKAIIPVETLATPSANFCSELAMLIQILL